VIAPWMRLAAVTLVVAAGCRSRPSPPPAPAAQQEAKSAQPSAAPAADAGITAFWAWFGKNASSLLAEPDPVESMKRISAELAKINPGVFAEIASEKDHRTMVLSADGNHELFPIVKKIYAARVPASGWTVVAFRQRDPTFNPIELNGRKLDARTMKFVAARNGEVLDVTIYVPGFTNEKEFGSILFVALDHTVGEHDSETRIGGIEWDSTAKAPAHARPLTELPALIDSTFGAP
jgi:hypothetical protein